MSRSRQHHHSNQDSYQEPCLHQLSPAATVSAQLFVPGAHGDRQLPAATTGTFVASFPTTSLHLTRITRPITRRRTTRRRRPIREVVRPDPHRICRGFAQEIPDPLIFEAHETDVQRWVLFPIGLGFGPGKEGQHRNYKRCDNDEQDQFVFHVCPSIGAFPCARTLSKFRSLGKKFAESAFFPCAGTTVPPEGLLVVQQSIPGHRWASRAAVRQMRFCMTAGLSGSSTREQHNPAQNTRSAE